MLRAHGEETALFHSAERATFAKFYLRCPWAWGNHPLAKVTVK